MNSFTFHALLHRRSFCITYDRPNKDLNAISKSGKERLEIDFSKMDEGERNHKEPI